MQLVELNHQLEVAQRQIAIRDELITERGLVLVSADGSEGSGGEGLANGDMGGPSLNGTAGNIHLQSSSCLQQLPSHSPSSYTILSKHNAEALKSIGGSDIGRHFYYNSILIYSILRRARYSLNSEV